MQQVIYAIYCTADETLPVYIGKTKNLKQRWRLHKSFCTNENSKHYNLPVYKFIRENHGLENWTIKEIYTLMKDEDGAEAEEYFINAVGMDGLLNGQHGVNYAHGMCEHGKQRHKCIECNGSSICEHGKQRHQCIECNGSRICEHGKMRDQCVECNGSSTCIHGKANKKQCKECYPWVCCICNLLTSIGYRTDHLGRKKHIKNLLSLGSQN
jgi:hypothetical protein